MRSWLVCSFLPRHPAAALLVVRLRVMACAVVPPGTLAPLPAHLLTLRTQLIIFTPQAAGGRI